MKSINAVVFGLFVAVLTLAGCEQAQAVDFSLGYQDNQVIDKEGVVASIGTQTKNGVMACCQMKQTTKEISNEKY